jgi:hypothetical protein
MSAETDVKDALSAYTDLTDEVDDRIYPDFLAQSIELPAVVYQRERTDYITTIHDGTVHDWKATMEIWCLAETRLGAEQIADLVELAIASTVLPVDRRPEFNAESQTFASVVTLTLWR